MIRYVLKRLLLALPTLLGVTLIAFILMKSVPGDPVYRMVGERTSPEVIARSRHRLCLDRSLLFQYGLFLKDISPLRRPALRTFNFGPIRGKWPVIFKRPYLGRSYATHQPVTRILADKFPHTVRLALAAMLVSVLAGISLGLLAAIFRGGLLDRLATLLAIGGISTPVFWTGLVLIIIFSNYFNWFPPSGMGRGALIFLVLPALTLGSRSAAYLARITRSSMLEVSSESYLTTARAKGLPERVVILKHAFRNALIPIITLAGLDFGSYLNGAVLTETIFSWDGVGRLAMNSILRRDYPVILGCVLLGAVVFVAANILVDISYAWIDPRIEHGA